MEEAEGGDDGGGEKEGYVGEVEFELVDDVFDEAVAEGGVWFGFHGVSIAGV